MSLHRPKNRERRAFSKQVSQAYGVTVYFEKRAVPKKSLATRFGAPLPSLPLPRLPHLAFATLCWSLRAPKRGAGDLLGEPFGNSPWRRMVELFALKTQSAWDVLPMQAHGFSLEAHGPE